MKYFLDIVININMHFSQVEKIFTKASAIEKESGKVFIKYQMFSILMELRHQRLFWDIACFETSTVTGKVVIYTHPREPNRILENVFCWSPVPWCS